MATPLCPISRRQSPTLASRPGGSSRSTRKREYPDRWGGGERYPNPTQTPTAIANIRSHPQSATNPRYSVGTVLANLLTIGGGIYLAILGHIWGAGIVIGVP